MAGSPLPDHHYTFAIGRGLHGHSLTLNPPVVAEGVASLQVTGLGAVCLPVPLDPEAGAVPDDRPCRWAVVAAAPLAMAAGGGKSRT